MHIGREIIISSYYQIDLILPLHLITYSFVILQIYEILLDFCLYQVYYINNYVKKVCLVKILKLNAIKKTFFGFQDISNALGITYASAQVTAHRYVQNGMLIRIKPNIFVLAEKWNNFSSEEKYQTANLLQVPSYVSLTTALEYYEITTQIQRNYIECISIRRTFSKKIRELSIRFSKVSEKLYFGFEKRNNVYIALPEKALIDALYLASFGRYSLDIAAVSKNRFDQKILSRMLETYPLRTKNLMRKYGFISPS